MGLAGPVRAAMLFAMRHSHAPLLFAASVLAALGGWLRADSVALEILALFAAFAMVFCVTPCVSG